ncbi:hypothetical protein RD792_006276 [Penstemon davidsonii]|uniref:Probable methylthioribulose-1-phosphate dehydratase n=1 Tax=Penstemon davidsonii TaxID=160366 RepID=A0ABR0DCH1_9LAMI|nr:hypothetical protein RD792_006276 [Penstemon davidsonii]
MEIGKRSSNPYVPKHLRRKCTPIESPITSSKAANAYAETYGVYETKALVSELCKQFYGLGWVLGTGGSVSVKVFDDKESKSDQLIVMSPSGVQKEKMMPEDMYVLSSDGVILSTPRSKPYPYNSPKCSECTPLFLQAYKIRNAGAVIHSHGIESCLVTMLRPLMKEFRIKHMEMIKGIEGHGYHDELVIPIIENTAKEGELIDSFTEAIRSYPKSTAVLVRNHGVYIWGETWISAKTQAECYHYLFDAAVKLHQLGLDWSSTPGNDTICNVNTVRGLSENLQTGVRTLLMSHVLMIFFVLGPFTNWSVCSVLRDIHYNYGYLMMYPKLFRCGMLLALRNAKDRRSFKEIFLTVGVDNPADILYVTDNLEEANDAEAAGTGGSVSIEVHDFTKSKSDQLIVMSPSGVQKERMVPEDMYVLSSNGVVLLTPLPKPYPYKFPKCSECTPLFLQAYKIRKAGAVIYSHGIEACLVTMIRPLMKEFRITHMEMIKGIEGHGYHDELVIPIIENTAKEGELIDSFTEAIKSYPRSTAVLVRNHGVYIWGETWISAKTQAECYHYLFDAAVKLHQLGLDWSTPNRVPICNANTVCGNSQRNVQKRFHSSIDTTDPPQDGNKEFFRIKRNTQLKKLMNDYCDRHSVEYNSLVFLFDGRRLRGDRTPDELEMEDGDEIDVLKHQ